MPFSGAPQAFISQTDADFVKNSGILSIYKKNLTAIRGGDIFICEILKPFRRGQ